VQATSAAFAAAVRRSHTRATRVVLLDAEMTVDEVLTGDGGVVLDGYVSTDADRRRSCQLSIANPAGTWTPEAPGDPFYPNRLLRLERGIIVDGAPEYVTLGTFLVDRPQVTVDRAGSTLSISGQDRIKLALKSRFTKPTRYDEGTPLADVVRSIAVAAGMGQVLYRLDDAGKSLAVDRTFDTGLDRWPALIGLARDYALALFVDAAGYLVLQPALSTGSLPEPAWAFTRGPEAIMIGLTKDWSDDRLYNHVLVSGEASDLVPVAAEARDLNPASPAYNPPDGTGPIGDRLWTYTSAMIRSVEQAQEVADARLLEVALIEEGISVPSVVHPAIEGGDVVSIVEPISHTSDDYIVDTLSIPLGAGAMTLTSRKLRSLS